MKKTKLSKIVRKAVITQYYPVTYMSKRERLVLLVRINGVQLHKDELESLS